MLYSCLKSIEIGIKITFEYLTTCYLAHCRSSIPIFFCSKTLCLTTLTLICEGRFDTHILGWLWKVSYPRNTIEINLLKILFKDLVLWQSRRRQMKMAARMKSNLRFKYTEMSRFLVTAMVVCGFVWVLVFSVQFLL